MTAQELDMARSEFSAVEAAHFLNVSGRSSSRKMSKVNCRTAW